MNAKSKLKTIIREEYKRARLINNINHLIVEQNKRYQWNSDQAEKAFPKTKDIKKAGEYLDKLPGRKKLTYNDTYKYLISLPSPKGGIGEQFYIHPSGTVLSVLGQQKFKWIWEDDKVKIVNPNGTMVGALEKDKSSTALDLSDEETSEGGSWLDTAQTVADWAGLIPVFGDFIDVINAIVYLAREKWLDGALSALAIIPVIGSPVKLGIKNAIKAAKGGAKMAKKVLKQAADPKVVEKFWVEIINSDKISKDLLKKLADDGLPYLSDLIVDTKNFAKKYKFDSKEFMTYLTQLDNFVKNSVKAIEEQARKAGREFAKDVASTYSKESLENLAKRIVVLKPGKKMIGSRGLSLTKLRDNLNLLFYNKDKVSRLGSLFKMDPRKLKQIEKAVIDQFEEELADPRNVDTLLSIGRTIEITKDIKNVGKIPVPAYTTPAGKLVLNPINTLNKLNSASAVEAYKNTLKKLPADEYRTFALKILNQAKGTDNFIYNLAKGSTSPSFRNIVDPKNYINKLLKNEKVLSTIGDMAMDYRRSISAMDPKAFDVWSNEIQELLDEAGYNFDSQTDNYDSVFVATVLAIVSATADPDTTNAVKNAPADLLIMLVKKYNISPRTGEVFKGAAYDIVDELPGDTKAEKKANGFKRMITSEDKQSYKNTFNDYDQDTTTTTFD